MPTTTIVGVGARGGGDGAVHEVGRRELPATQLHAFERAARASRVLDDELVRARVEVEGRLDGLAPHREELAPAWRWIGDAVEDEGAVEQHAGRAELDEREHVRPGRLRSERGGGAERGAAAGEAAEPDQATVPALSPRSGPSSTSISKSATSGGTVRSMSHPCS